jgi:ribosome biogenesis protein YTM1
VNGLLQTEADARIPFEFLINGQFLRTSLDEFLTQNGISAETTLQVEYIKALIPPQFVNSYHQDDWISSVDVLSLASPAASWAAGKEAESIQSRILSGSYDGVLRVWNMSNEVVATGQGHTASIKSVKFITPTQVVSSGIDRTLRLWKYADAAAGPASLTPTLELFGHKASVDNLAVHAPTSRILSASADCRIGLWSTKKSDAPAAPESLLPSANKRRKLSGPSVSTAQRGALSILEGHQQAVGDVCFDVRDPSVAYSASHDHTVKTWDLTTSKCVDTRNTAQSLLAICHLPTHNLLATGGALRYISLVDPRASATTVSAMTLRGHTNIITALARDPDSDYQFISASNDGTCRIWDIRSARTEAGAEKVGECVFVIDRFQPTAGSNRTRALQGDESRVFSVCWDHEVGIVSGGRDKEIQIHNSKPA